MFTSVMCPLSYAEQRPLGKVYTTDDMDVTYVTTYQGVITQTWHAAYATVYTYVVCTPYT